MTGNRALAFDYLRRGSPPEGADAPWFGALRRQRAAELALRGLPSTKVEAWKYTNLANLAKLDFRPAPREPSPARVAEQIGRLASGTPHRLVLVNGRYRPDLSSLAGLGSDVTIDLLSGADKAAESGAEAEMARFDRPDRPFLEVLNAALMESGLLVRVAPGTRLDVPLEIVSIGLAEGGPGVLHPRLIVSVGAGAHLTLIERHVGGGDGIYWTNPVVQFDLAPEAEVRAFRLQDEAADAYHLALTEVRLDARARFSGVGLALGGGLSRHEIHATLAGEGATIALAGAALLNERQHCDITTEIDHGVANCTSRQNFRQVVDGAARGVFQGRVIVREDAQKTDGHLSCRALLLSAHAEADSKPELEIYADDVKCSHGSTTGTLDDQALFYLRARGIGEADARRLLVEAFLGEVIDAMDDAPFATECRVRIASRLMRRASVPEAA